MIVDGHLHVFRPSSVLPRTVHPALAPPQRDASIEDLLRLQTRAGVDGAVLVPLGPELEYLDRALRSHPNRFAGIAVADERIQGQIPGVEPVAELSDRLDRIPVHGLRVGWLGEPSSQLTESPMRGVLDELQRRGLVLWTYLPAEQLGLLEQVVNAYPELVVVINHLGLCPKDMQVDAYGRPWFEPPSLVAVPFFVRLAAHPQVHMTFSGQYAISRQEPPYHDLDDYVRPLIEAFTTRRLMWASDWPWTADVPGYPALMDLPRQVLPGASADELAEIMGGTAVRLFPHLGADHA